MPHRLGPRLSPVTDSLATCDLVQLFIFLNFLSCVQSKNCCQEIRISRSSVCMNAWRKPWLPSPAPHMRRGEGSSGFQGQFEDCLHYVRPYKACKENPCHKEQTSWKILLLAADASPSLFAKMAVSPPRLISEGCQALELNVFSQLLETSC